MGRTLHQVQHIFFDLDHTLWDMERSSIETLEELFDEYGYRAKGLDLHIFKNRFAEITDRHWRLYGEGKITKHQIRERRFVELLVEMGVPADDVPPQLTIEYTHRCPRKPHLIPHTLNVLEQLSERYHLHVITNGYKEVQVLKMECSGLLPYFDKIITSECGHGQKPGRKIFEYAQSLTGATVANALMVGDNPDTDISGAADMGWASIFYNPKGLKVQARADYEVECISEITGLLEIGQSQWARQ